MNSIFSTCWVLCISKFADSKSNMLPMRTLSAITTYRRSRLPLTAVSALATTCVLPEGLVLVICDFPTSKRWTIEEVCEVTFHYWSA